MHKHLTLSLDTANYDDPMVAQMWFARGGPSMSQHHKNQTSTRPVVAYADLGHINQTTVG